MNGFHERDCAPCHAAREVVATLAVELDPLDNWPDVEVEGVSVQQRLTSLTASVLHRYPPLT